MNWTKFTMAALTAVGGVVGLASQASAATTVTEDIPDNQSLTPITLVGATNEFAYGELSYPVTDFNAYGGAAINPTPFATDPGFPTRGETSFNDQSVKTASLLCRGPCSTGYFQLKFTDGGSNYVGTAYVDNTATLETISYQQVPFAVPEPDAWALLVAGLGMTGAVARRNRRRAQAAMA